MFFLIATIVIIRRQFGWRQGRATDGEAKSDLAKTELVIITKLAVIMGNMINNLYKISTFTTGVFWIGEFISTAIGIEYGHHDTCYAQLFLDIPNLLAVKHKILQTAFV